tara:strand:+ start:566 stop:808 length:243 start_codon:yes stop_codon:yes gene_type:complete
MNLALVNFGAGTLLRPDRRYSVGLAMLAMLVVRGLGEGEGVIKSARERALLGVEFEENMPLSAKGRSGMALMGSMLLRNE